MNAAAGSLATERSFLTALLERGRISPLAADRLQRMQAETGDRLCSVLLKLGLLSEADLLAEMSTHTAIEAAGGSLTPCVLEGVDLNSAFLHAHEVVPLAVQPLAAMLPR